MEGRRSWWITFTGLVLIVGLGTTARVAQAQTCPSGYTSCINSDTTYYCISSTFACGRPDSGSIEAFLRKKAIGGTFIVEPEPAEELECDMTASDAERAAEGAFLDVLVNSGRSTMMRAALARRMIVGTLRWVVVLTPTGFLPPSHASIAVRAGMRSVGFFHPMGGTVVAELPEFPSHLRIETSAAGTFLTFGFRSPLEVRIPHGTWRVGGSSTTDHVTLSTLAGSAGGVTSVTLDGQGIGTVTLSGFSTTEVEALRSPMFFPH